MADPATFDKASCGIAVLHERGRFTYPAHLNFSSHDVFRFLAERVPDCGGRDVNPVLADYLERQEQYFGPHSVATFPRGKPPATGSRSGYRASCIGLILAGVAWSAYAFSGIGETAWGLAGVIGIVAGVSWRGQLGEGMPAGPAFKNGKDASLVIGPHGMAMIQGDVQGEVPGRSYWKSASSPGPAASFSGPRARSQASSSASREPAS